VKPCRVMISKMVNLLGTNKGYRVTPEETGGQPLCTRGSLTPQVEDLSLSEAEERLYTLPTHPEADQLCGMCQVEEEGESSGEESDSKADSMISLRLNMLRKGQMIQLSKS
jgi:hypothetical protein